MSKTKTIIIISAVIVAAALVVLGVKFASKPADNSATENVTSTAVQTNANISVDVTGENYTTLKPFVDSQIEEIPPTSATTEQSSTTAPFVDTQTQAPATTEAYDEHATQIDVANGWKDNDLTADLPKINSSGISTYNYVSDKGYRTVIRIQNFDYNSYLTYIDRLEDAGFKDNNNRAHIPATAPSTVAMFYSKFDGERSFGVYWYGNSSSAGFDCEIVISDYDQAK